MACAKYEHGYAAAFFPPPFVCCRQRLGPLTVRRALLLLALRSPIVGLALWPDQKREIGLGDVALYAWVCSRSPRFVAGLCQRWPRVQRWALRWVALQAEWPTALATAAAVNHMRWWFIDAPDVATRRSGGGNSGAPMLAWFVSWMTIGGAPVDSVLDRDLRSLRWEIMCASERGEAYTIKDKNPDELAVALSEDPAKEAAAMAQFRKVEAELKRRREGARN